MAGKAGIEMRGMEAVTERFERAPRTADSYITKNLITLGGKLQSVMRRVLKPVKFKGRMEQSVGWGIQKEPPIYTLTVGPTAAHRVFVRFGTRPHWAPIGPLKEWAKVKLGSENAAYGVQRSIAHHGTSVWYERIGIGDGHGGFDYPTKTLGAQDAQTVIARTARRIPLDVATALNGEQPAEGGA